MISKTMSTVFGAHYIKKLIMVVLLLLLILIGYIGYWLNQTVVLDIRIHNNGKVVFEKNLHQGDTFTLEYTHSVTARPVYEVYYVRSENTLGIKEMRYDSFGANLPVGPEKLKNETTKFIVEDGFYKILYEDRHFDKVPLRVGQVIANHTLVFEDGEKVRFLDVANGGEYVEFYVEPLLTKMIRGLNFGTR